MSFKKAPLIALALFIAIPIIEISLFIQVGSLIGLWPTVLVVVLTALIGSTLLRIQGQSIFLQAKQSLAEHKFPARSVLEGIILLVCGLLLLTPGFFTDAIGFLLMFPFVRALFIDALIQNTQVDLSESPTPSSSSSDALEDDQTIIEGEFRDL